MMSKKILFVDDEEKLRMNVKVFLEMSGYEVILAQDGEEGLAKLEAEKPDCIITDVMMPRKDGFTMLKEIRSKEEYRNYPIIMLTAKESIRDLYELEGANDYLPKPFEMTALVTSVKNLVGE